MEVIDEQESQPDLGAVGFVLHFHFVVTLFSRSVVITVCPARHAQHVCQTKNYFLCIIIHKQLLAGIHRQYMPKHRCLYPLICLTTKHIKWINKTTK